MFLASEISTEGFINLRTYEQYPNGFYANLNKNYGRVNIRDGILELYQSSNLPIIVNLSCFRWNKEPLNITDPSVDPEIDYVRNGDLVRLEHVITRRNIHSHNQPAPVMKRLFQVETYHQQVSVCLCF